MLPAQLSHVTARPAPAPHCSEPTLHWAGTATTPGHGARENQRGAEREPGAPSQRAQPSCDNHTGDITQTRWHHGTTPTGRSDNRPLQGCGQARGRREEGLAPSKCPDPGGHTHPLLDLYVHCQLNSLRSCSPQAREATGEERGHGSASQPALPAPRGQKAVTSSSTAPVKKTNIPRFY